MPTAREILHQVFGYDNFRAHQADIIDQQIQGNDALVLMPTGGGKSLCYQIPALLRDGTGVIISPLIALMQDQVDALRQLGIKAAYLNSTLDYEASREVERQLLDKQLDLLYIAPERLTTQPMLELLDRSSIALFAIDEAHCVSQWGHDFRPEYQQLKILHQRYPDVPRIALTATADKRTQDEIITQLQLENAVVFTTSFDRPNIRYSINDAAQSREHLWRFIQQEHPEDSGIVYCLSRKKVEAIAEWLQLKGRTALPYHAGLSAQVRQLHQGRFLREDGVIIVATIAFGMGIDKPDVRFVAHLNLPKSIEAYYQETGRAGRDGLPANAWMAYGLQDVIMLRQMSQESAAEEHYKQVEHQKLEAMLSLCETVTCRRQALLGYFAEQTPGPCGNCDNCLLPPETWDATTAAQKALSTVYRTGQRFGVNYLVDILLGKEGERILNNRHDQLSTFGIGKELSNTEWRRLFRQLIALGYLIVDTAHGGLKLNESSRPLLRNEQTLQLRKHRKAEKRSAKVKAAALSIPDADKDFWESLRATRMQLAEEQGVPPYVIFHDSTLKAFLEHRPTDHESMAQISGVGAKKLEKYGEDFLQVIAEYL